MMTVDEFKRKYRKKLRLYEDDGCLFLEDKIWGMIATAGMKGVNLFYKLDESVADDFKALADNIFHYTYKEQESFVKCYQVVLSDSLLDAYGINFNNHGLPARWCVLCIEGKMVSVVATFDELLEAGSLKIKLERSSLNDLVKVH